MSSVQVKSPETADVAAPREMQVVNWPLRDDPLYAGLVLVGCLVTGVGAGLISSSWSMGLLGTIALAATFWKLWFPITCKLDPTGITVSVWRWRRHTAWRDIDQLQLRGRGVLVTARDRPSSTSCRGLYLPWSGDRTTATEIGAHYRPRSADGDTTVSRSRGSDDRLVPR